MRQFGLTIAITAAALSLLTPARSTCTESAQIAFNGDGSVIWRPGADEFQTSAVEIDGGAFTQIVAPESGWAGEAGGPAVPTYGIWIEIPANMRPLVTARLEGERTVDNVTLAPFPSIERDNPNLASASAISETAYNSDTFIPESNASVASIISIGGKRFACINATPYRYNPARRELKFAEGFEVSVEFEPDPAAGTVALRADYPVYREMRRALSAGNPLLSFRRRPESRRDKSRDDIGVREDYLGHYVVVVRNDDILEIVQPLLDWKMRKGYLVTVANLDEIGNDINDLQNYLQEAWDEWDYPPTFVLLAGDAQGDARIPFYRHQLYGVANGGWHASDNQFVCWENGPNGDRDPETWVPEGFIGRLAASTEAELDHMVSKLLAYEMEPFVENPWVEGAVLISNGVRSCTHTNVAVRELMTQFGYRRDDVHEAYSDWHLGQRPDLNIVFGGINAGVGFVNFRGYNNWGDIFQNQIRALSNGSKMPIVTGMVCGTNDFTNSWQGDAVPECRGEAFQRSWSNGPRGAVASFGPTDLYTHTWFNNTMDANWYHALLNNDVNTLGALSVLSKISLLRNYPSNLQLGNGTSVGYYFYTYVLLGDPGMQVWTREPQPVEVEFSAELPEGSTKFTAVVRDGEGEPVPGAYIHVQSEDARFGAYSDARGTVDLAVDPLPAGEYLLTVTGANLIPTLEGFEVVVPAVHYALEAVQIDDDNDGDSHGNGDGKLNPGETIELTLNLRNTGTDDGADAVAFLTSHSAFAQVQRGEVDFDGIAAGEAVAGNAPFLVSLLPEAPDAAELGFSLRIVQAEDVWSAGFNLATVGYAFEMNGFYFIDRDLLPGESRRLVIQVQNRGDWDAGGVTATLYCSSDRIQIRGAESPIGDIPVGETGDNSERPFEVAASPLAYQGSEISFGLLLASESGARDSLSFTVTLGEPIPSSPQGPTEYGYMAFDDRDTTGGAAPEFDWVEGDTRLNGLADANENPNWNSDHGARVFVDLPFEFAYFGIPYDEITVGSNGWLSFGRSDMIAWNNQELNSPIAPRAMLCPYWDDLWDGTVYTRYDEDNARFVVEWRSFTHLRGRVTFAVHLYDPTVRVTQTGDGEFYFLYDQLPMDRDYADENATIGFGSPDRGDGMTIRHANTWDPRTADLGEGSVIRFTTGEFTERGTIRGNVTDAADDEPMRNVRVMIDETGFFAETDGDGNFSIENVPVGEYSVTARRLHFNDANEGGIEVIEDEVAVVNFSLTHPTFNIDIEEIRYGVMPDSSGEVGFRVWNEGNGSLGFNLELNYEAGVGNGRDEPWDIVFDFAVSDTVHDTWLQGITTDGERIYISGQMERGFYPHKIYVLDKQGSQVGEIDQFNVDSSAVRGYGELEWTGENLLAIDNNQFVEITLEGEFVRQVQAPERPTSALAYAADRGTVFSKSITGNNFFETDRDGNVVASYRAGQPSLRTYGLFWHIHDQDGFPLYIFSDNRDFEEDGTKLELSKMSVETGEIVHVKDIFLEEGDRPQGSALSKKWDPLLWTFITLINRPSGDHVVGFELAPNLTWISYDPVSGAIEPEESQGFTVQFFSADMPAREYFVVLELFHNAVGDRYDIPVYFTVGEVAVPQPEPNAPRYLAFDAPWPNPFNHTARLTFALADPALATLQVVDIHGRVVETIARGWMPAGAHEVLFDGAELPSGVYFARLESSGRIFTRKLVLVR